MAEKLLLKTSAKDNTANEYRFRLEFYVFQENDVYIAYCPSLDISTSGETFNDAVGNFYEMFQLHIEWCVEHGTLLQDLTEHGWKVKKNGTHKAVEKRKEHTPRITAGK